MRIGISSQNFRTITGHAGKTRRFLIFESQSDDGVIGAARLDLPKSMSMHEFRGDDHPLFELDVLVTASCGEGFVRRLGTQGVKVVATSESDPARAAAMIVAGDTLAPPSPHDH